MKTSLSPISVERLLKGILQSEASLVDPFPRDPAARQPVHVIYGGAHLFKFDTAPKLGRLALRAFDTYAPDERTFAAAFDIPRKLASKVFVRVRQKLESEPVEDLRIDFEDGYGPRADDEEDAHAVSAATEVARGMAAHTLPPFTGIRIKSLSAETAARAVRTLDLFLTELCDKSGGYLPENFVVTLPKVVSADQIAAVAGILNEIESASGLAAGLIKLEVMIETPQSILAPDGTVPLMRFYDAAGGRCVSAHFGAYDYLAGCGVSRADQELNHSACDFARNIMQVAFAGTGVRLSDGATNVLPIAPNRGENLSPEMAAENSRVVHQSWKTHYDNCRRSLGNGFYQSWDLHPAQLPARYAAVYSHFLEGIDLAGERLRNFIGQAARASLVGNTFDDAATVQGLLNYFVRAVNCGAVSDKEVAELTGLNTGQLRSGSFAMIMRQ